VAKERDGWLIEKTEGWVAKREERVTKERDGC
jgi:hypothetical protein